MLFSILLNRVKYTTLFHHRGSVIYEGHFCVFLVPCLSSVILRGGGYRATLCKALFVKACDVSVCSVSGFACGIGVGP